MKSDLRDLGVQLSNNLSFNIHIENTIAAASKLVGWGLRTFKSRGREVMLTLLKSLVQPKLDYCSQLWSPADQSSINKLEAVQHHLVGSIQDKKLEGLDYWEKLQELKLYSQERRRDRYQVIFLWKISQEMVSGYDVNFTSDNGRTGRKIIPNNVVRTAPALVRNARERTIGVRGAQIFNLLPDNIRNTRFSFNWVTAQLNLVWLSFRFRFRIIFRFRLSLVKSLCQVSFLTSTST